MQWAPGITDIQIRDNLGSTPAAVAPATGVIYINRDFLGKLTRDQWVFVLLHEWAHIAAKSRDEKLVDMVAFREYVKRGYSLKQSVYALTKLLNFKNREHFERANLQMQRAAAHDYLVNGNGKMKPKS